MIKRLFLASVLSVMLVLMFVPLCYILAGLCAIWLIARLGEATLALAWVGVKNGVYFVSGILTIVVIFVILIIIGLLA